MLLLLYKIAIIDFLEELAYVRRRRKKKKKKCVKSFPARKTGVMFDENNIGHGTFAEIDQK